MRIVSLLPAATEIVCAIGLQDALVGVSHECDFPPSIKHLPQLTKSNLCPSLNSQQIDDEVRSNLERGESLYALDERLLEEVRPDLVITQSLCDVCAINLSEVHEASSRLSPPPRVLDINPRRLSDVFQAITSIGDLTNQQSEASQLNADLAHRISRVQSIAKTRKKPAPLNLLMLEWIMPPFSAGHWNPELIQLGGASPVLAKQNTASTELSWEQILGEQVDMIVCACCGFNARRTASDWEQAINEVPAAAALHEATPTIWALDGSQYFNRGGPRLVESLELLAYLINPTDQQEPEEFQRVAQPIKMVTA